ncbi:hypothetical protein Tco_0036916, partial [Tanacetum coccineum]
NAPGLINPLRPNLGVLQIGIRANVKENQGTDEELSDRGSPRVIVYGYDGLPMQPVLYVPEPEYPEYLAPSEAEASLEDQPLPVDASPTALSPGDDDDEPSDDDDDDDDTDDEDEEPFEDEDDDDEEEEHLALADSSAVPVVDLVPSAGDTKAFKTDESAPTPRSP